MIPLNCKSLRTTSVKSVAWVLAASLREAKSATATRAFSAPRPVPVRNQSWAEAWLARIRNNAAARIALDRLKSPITPTSRIHLIWIDGAGKHVSPAHPQVEIESGANVGRSARRGAGSSRNPGGAARAIRDSIFGRRSLALKGAGLVRGRQSRLFFLELRKLGCVRLRFGNLWFGFLLVEALRGVHGAAFGHDGRVRHGDAGKRADQIHLDAAAASASNAAPCVAPVLDKRRNGYKGHQQSV